MAGQQTAVVFVSGTLEVEIISAEDGTAVLRFAIREPGAFSSQVIATASGDAGDTYCIPEVTVPIHPSSITPK